MPQTIMTTCSQCGKAVETKFPDQGTQPAGWLIIEAAKTLSYRVGDFCSWRCIADYAAKKEAEKA